MSSLAGTKEASRDLSRRSAESEWLDAADASPEELAHVLRDLARFNGAMLGHWPVIDWLRRATRDAPKEKALTLVDVGCGYGDLLRAIRRWARKRGLTIRLIGLDLSCETIRIAQTVTDGADEIDYCVMDVFDFAPPVPIDFVVSSLVTHHMSDDLIAKFSALDGGDSAQRLADLRPPTPPGALLFHHPDGKLTRLHPMVIHDGRISVARSLTRTEWLERIGEAGIARDAVRLRWFLFRFAIGRLR